MGGGAYLYIVRQCHSLCQGINSLRMNHLAREYLTSMLPCSTLFLPVLPLPQPWLREASWVLALALQNSTASGFDTKEENNIANTWTTTGMCILDRQQFLVLDHFRNFTCETISKLSYFGPFDKCYIPDYYRNYIFWTLPEFTFSQIITFWIIQDFLCFGLMQNFQVLDHSKKV